MSSIFDKVQPAVKKETMRVAMITAVGLVLMWILFAGLECGLFYKKMEGLDCVSLGPDMKDIHTSEEVLSISSTERVWKYLVKVLEALKE